MTTRVYKIVMTPEDTNDRVAYMIDRTDESPVTEDTALVTEDNRIPEIRAVLDEYVRPDDLDALHAVRRRIRVILDRTSTPGRRTTEGGTVTEERCERTELIVNQCAHCLGYTEPVVDEVQLDGREHDGDAVALTVEAQYFGRCPACDETIRPGELITKVGGVSNSAPQWVCAGCAP